MSEALYVDASAAVKVYLEEEGTAEALAAIDHSTSLATSRITYVEVGRALARRVDGSAERDLATETWASDWRDHAVVELTQGIAEHAVSLAVYHGLRSTDAIHLASALAIPPAPLRFATWDRKLWDAARAVGLRTVPAERP